MPAALTLGDLLGRPVMVDGDRVGALRDLAVALNDPHPAITAVCVAASRRSVRWAPWAAVANLDESALRLRPEGWMAAGATPGAHELLLARHVLDGQIVDVAGKRVVRVGDVELIPDAGRLRLAGVQTGAEPVLRRLGLRRLARRARSEAIDWSEIHPSSGRAHDLHLRSPASRVHRMSPDQLAELVVRLPVASGAEVLGAVEPGTAAGALAAAHPETAARLSAHLHPEDERSIMERLPGPTRRRLAERPAPKARRFRNILRFRRRAPS